jgi:glycosyltransferase involved in cell wall biosynthesis
MIIGFDASRANRPDKSGVEWYAYHLLRNFYNLDHKNEYLLYTEKHLQSELLPPVPNFQEKVLRWPLCRFWTLGRLSMEMALHKPDLLFVPAHNFPLIKAKKNVITWHDIGYERYPETYTAWELRSLREGGKSALRSADAIITASNFNKQEMLRWYKINPDRIKVIYAGCKTDFWKKSTEEEIKILRAQLNLDAPYFLYLGRLALRKNIIGLIRAYNSFRAKINKPFYLLLAGSDGSFQEDINREIELSPYKEEIKRLGWFPLDQAPILFSGASAFLFPSFYEGFGLPILEAMSCEVPVIASTSGALPEIAGDAAILVPAHDITGFADQMLNIVTDNNLRAEMIAKGLARVKEFSWEKCAQETLDLLERV